VATISAAAMPAPGAGPGTLLDMDADTEDKFLADFAREFMQHSASLELPASLVEFSSFPSPAVDLPPQVGRNPTSDLRPATLPTAHRCIVSMHTELYRLQCTSSR